MRIRTDGKFEHRKDTIESLANALDESNNTNAILEAAEHVVADREAKLELAALLVELVDDGHVTPDVAQRIVDTLDGNRLAFAPTIAIDVDGGLEE